MKIDIKKLGGHQNLQFELHGDWFHHLIARGESIDFKLKTVYVNCDILKAQDRLILTGQIDTAVTMSCGRCLEEAQVPLKTDFKYILVAVSGEDLPKEKELSPDDPDVLPYQEESLDLEPLILEQIVLHIPMRALCKEDCSGLCPSCGVNLNLTTCDCRHGGFDSRFAALAGIKLNKQ